MGQKFLVIGAWEMAGISSKTGNSFNMCVMGILVPVESVSSQKFSKNGYGLEYRELPLDPKLLESFRDFRGPALCEVDFTPSFSGRRVENIVSGWKRSTVAAAA